MHHLVPGQRLLTQVQPDGVGNCLKGVEGFDSRVYRLKVAGLGFRV